MYVIWWIILSHVSQRTSWKFHFDELFYLTSTSTADAEAGRCMKFDEFFYLEFPNEVDGYWMSTVMRCNPSRNLVQVKWLYKWYIVLTILFILPIHFTDVSIFHDTSIRNMLTKLCILPNDAILLSLLLSIVTLLLKSMMMLLLQSRWSIDGEISLCFHSHNQAKRLY